MDTDEVGLLFVIAVSGVLVAVATALHLVLFRLLVALDKRTSTINPGHVAGAVVIAIFFHLFEIILFAFGIFWLTSLDHYGELRGISRGDLPNFFYYSAVTYTTLGFGDITPVGPIRIVTAFESLTGLVLAAWTASIIFFSVRRFGIQMDSEAKLAAQTKEHKDI